MRTFFISVMIMALAVTSQAGLAQTTTIVLIRHAEKDTASSGNQMMQADPALSAAGQARATNLLAALKGFTIQGIYSTNFKRTQQTVTPLANSFRLNIQSYDPRNQGAFAEQLKQQTGKTIVVVGHSNTIPRLVNLLIGDPKKYDDLPDTVYDKIFIVRITDGVATVEIKTY